MSPFPNAGIEKANAGIFVVDTSSMVADKSTMPINQWAVIPDAGFNPNCYLHF